jgi:hypothetical protein
VASLPSVHVYSVLRSIKSYWARLFLLRVGLLAICDVLMSVL